MKLVADKEFQVGLLGWPADRTALEAVDESLPPWPFLLLRLMFIAKPSAL